MRWLKFVLPEVAENDVVQGIGSKLKDNCLHAKVSTNGRRQDHPQDGQTDHDHDLLLQGGINKKMGEREREKAKG